MSRDSFFMCQNCAKHFYAGPSRQLGITRQGRIQTQLPDTVLLAACSVFLVPGISTLSGKQLQRLDGLWQGQGQCHLSERLSAERLAQQGHCVTHTHSVLRGD